MNTSRICIPIYALVIVILCIHVVHGLWGLQSEHVIYNTYKSGAIKIQPKLLVLLHGSFAQLL